MAIIDYLPNYKEHPTKDHYLIFSFTKRQTAATFEDNLNQNNIPFEKDEDEHGVEEVFFYAIRTYYRKEAVKQNLLALAKHRKPLIANKILKYVILAIFFLLLLGVIVGAISKS